MNPRVILASLHLFTTTGFIPGKTALTLMNDLTQASRVFFVFICRLYLNLNKINILFICRTDINVLHALYCLYVFCIIIIFIIIANMWLMITFLHVLVCVFVLLFDRYINVNS